MSYRQRDRHIAQWKRIEVLEVDPHRYNHFILDRSTKTNQWEKDSFTTNSLETIAHSYAKNIPQPIPHILYKN